MKHLLKKVLIKICTGFLYGFVYIISALTWLIEAIAKLIEIVLILFLLSVAGIVIADLPEYWQSLILTTILLGCTLFTIFFIISVIVLRVLKPKKFDEIFSKLYGDKEDNDDDEEEEEDDDEKDVEDARRFLYLDKVSKAMRKVMKLKVKR